MATNRYAAPCSVCGARVPAGGGTRARAGRGWSVTHIACDAGPSVITTVFASGASVTRNTRGYCEDAPCCGCCSF